MCSRASCRRRQQAGCARAEPSGAQDCTWVRRQTSRTPSSSPRQARPARVSRCPVVVGPHEETMPYYWKPSGGFAYLRALRGKGRSETRSESYHRNMPPSRSPNSRETTELELRQEVRSRSNRSRWRISGELVPTAIGGLASLASGFLINFAEGGSSGVALGILTTTIAIATTAVVAYTAYRMVGKEATNKTYSSLSEIRDVPLRDLIKSISEAQTVFDRTLKSGSRNRRQE